MNNVASRKEAVEALLKRVPSFAAARAEDESYTSHDDDSAAYLVYGDFAHFLIELILDQPGAADKEGVLAESFKLLSELATSPNDELANIAIVGTFEMLADRPDCAILARKMLSKDTAKVFNRVMRGWI